MKGNLTEEYLSSTFETVVGSDDWVSHFGLFGFILKEVDCHQGRPDYVASTRKLPTMSETQRKVLGGVLSAPSTARVISLLKAAAPRTAEYLVRASGFSAPVVRRSLATLLSLDLVERTGSAGYVLSSGFPTLDWELWAFEVKLEHWQRALFQALQYRAFAHRSVVVISEHSAHRLERYTERFRTLNVGVIAMDAYSGTFRLIVKPKKRSPASRFHHLYALGKVLCGLDPCF